MESPEKIIAQTKKWITEVVAGCNFCPFAAKELKYDSIYYIVVEGSEKAVFLETLIIELQHLDNKPDIETSIIIIPNALQKFEDYLEIISISESLLKKEGYEGMYQLASFHPLYQFEGCPIDDAANYTNRSLYPMIHILREESIENALSKYPNPEQIPNRNIDFARKKGLIYMQMLRDSCM